jgi:hypothetical protein
MPHWVHPNPTHRIGLLIQPVKITLWRYGYKIRLKRQCAAFFVKARDPEHLPCFETSQLTSERTRRAAGLPVQSPLPAKN